MSEAEPAVFLYSPYDGLASSVMGLHELYVE
jgi:hypothetical protein